MFFNIHSRTIHTLIQLAAMPLIAAYLTSTGVFWVWAALLGYFSSFLVILPFALITGIKMCIKVNQTE